MCDGADAATLYAALSFVGIVCIAVLAFLLFRPSARRKTKWIDFQRLEAFGERVQTKYKILVTFTQVMSTVAT